MKDTPKLVKPGSRIGLGMFDGLHKGHQIIANQTDVLLTFYPHPDTVLGKPFLGQLTLPDELATFVPCIHILPFTESVSQIGPIDFLNTYIQPLLPHTLVAGYDFRFGHRQLGTTQTLSTWCQDRGIQFTEIPPITDSGIPIKSQTIRELIATGKIDSAVHLLGHPYLIQGTVIHGDHRGRLLGFPTANLMVSPEKLVPKAGIYGGWMSHHQEWFRCLIYIGNRPTFDGITRQIEVLVDGLDENLYDQTLSIHIAKMIRDECKFSSTEELISAITNDRNHLRSTFKPTPSVQFQMY